MLGFRKNVLIQAGVNKDSTVEILCDINWMVEPNNGLE